MIYNFEHFNNKFCVLYKNKFVAFSEVIFWRWEKGKKMRHKIRMFKSMDPQMSFKLKSREELKKDDSTFIK